MVVFRGEMQSAQSNPAGRELKEQVPTPPLDLLLVLPISQNNYNPEGKEWIEIVHISYLSAQSRVRRGGVNGDRDGR